MRAARVEVMAHRARRQPEQDRCDLAVRDSALSSRPDRTGARGLPDARKVPSGKWVTTVAQRPERGRSRSQTESPHCGQGYQKLRPSTSRSILYKEVLPSHLDGASFDLCLCC